LTTQKILIVDDDPDIRSLYRLVLHQEGLDVVEAESGQEALSKVQAERPALVLLDIMMPEMDGYEVCRQLRADPQTARLPVLMFSAKGTSDDRKNGMLVGADDFVTKSAGPRALVTRIRSLLSSTLSSNGAIPAPAVRL
jgi:two-component system phosphate regulon response regulator PhoB